MLVNTLFQLSDDNMNYPRFYVLTGLITIGLLVASTACNTEQPRVSISDGISFSEYSNAVVPILSSIAAAARVYVYPMERAHYLDDSEDISSFNVVADSATAYAEEMDRCRNLWDALDPPDVLIDFHINYASYIQVEEESAKLLASNARARDMKGISYTMQVREDNFSHLQDCLKAFKETIGSAEKSDTDDIML